MLTCFPETSRSGTNISFLDVWLKAQGSKGAPVHHVHHDSFLLSQLNPLGFFWLSAVSLAAAIAPKVVEPVCSDTLWRLIKVRRGGGRGHAQKCRLISEESRGGQLIDQHPFVLDEHYVNSWGGQVVHAQYLRSLRGWF